jgi:competence protein ComEA
MFKRLLLSVAFCLSTIGAAFAADTEINKADLAGLDSVKGIGPSLAKNIIDERKKGDFKDWSDFEKRVKGVKEKRALKLSDAGLRINGQAVGKSAPAPAPAAKPAKKDDPKKS